MKAAAANLLSLIKGPKQFVIPIYQRTYSWQQAQCEQLLRDILRISDSEDIHGHFVGSVVYFQESLHNVSDVPQLQVIDGQQRLTTVTLLIAALADFVKDNPDIIDTNATKLKNYYLFNAEEDGDLHYKLLLTRRDKQTLISLLKEIPHTEPASQRILENYQFFKSQINATTAIAIYNGLMRLFVVDVALEKNVDNPQLIFESLNSTGLDLSQADLIRNYVLMGQPHKQQTELYEKYWYPMEQGFGDEYTQRFDAFMRDYLSVKTGNISRIAQVYDEFKQYAYDWLRTSTLDALLADVQRYANFYTNMALHQEPSEKILNVFRRISRIRVDVCYPFLLAVYSDYANNVISEEELIEVLCLVESYVFRRSICGIPPNSLNKTFANLYKSVIQEQYVESVQAAFLLLTTYKLFPLDTEFKNALLTKDVYNFRNGSYLLERLENYKRKEPINVEDYTIEHVMPQNPHLNNEWQQQLGDNWKLVQETWLHSLGNLTLTGYNAEMSDKSFEKKKCSEEGFDHSPLHLNTWMRQVDEWNEEQIKGRANDLINKAIKVWQAPYLDEETLSKYQ